MSSMSPKAEQQQQQEQQLQLNPEPNDISISTRTQYERNGPEAQRIAAVIPYFPFKGIPRFYDIGGFLARPDLLQLVIDIFASRYESMEIDSILGIDARGFVLGPPIALKLKKPFYMVRKPGKMPNTVQSPSYDVEYGKRQGVCISKDAVKCHDRVVIIDDLVATGGTLSAAIQLVHLLGGTVVECACVVELQMFVDPPPESGLPSRTQLFRELGIDHVPIWGLLSEDILTLKADLPSDYTDDGEEH